MESEVNEMKFHLVLTKKDTDIIAFKNSVSPKTFGELVTKILKRAVRGRVAEIPMSFEINDEVCEMHTKIELDDELVKECQEVLGFEKGRFTACVKQEIRRCINKNLVIPKKEHIDNSPFKEILDNASLSIKKRKAELVDSPEKFRKMHKSYRAILSDVSREFYKMF